MFKLELNPDETKLLLDYLQNSSINNINGHAMIALASIMGRLAKEVVALNDEEQKADGA